MLLPENKKAGVVIYNLAFLLVFLFVAECFLRFTGIGYDNAAFEPDTVLHHIHKKNYFFIHDNPSEKEYSNIHVYYDNWGCVSNPSAKQGAFLQKTRIALVGDSYIEGLQVPFEKSLTGLLQKNSGDKFAIKNFAVGGYSPVLYYLQLQQIIPLFHPQKIVLFLYANDVREDAEYLRQGTFDSHQRLIAVNGGMNPFKYYIIRNSYIIRLIRKLYMQAVYYSTIHEKETVYIIKNTVEEKPLLTSATSYYLDSIVQLCLLTKCELILSAIPSKYKISHGIPHDTSDFAVQCRNWALAKKVKFINLVPDFEIAVNAHESLPFFTKDIHFNIQGHALVEKAVLAKLRE